MADDRYTPLERRLTRELQRIGVTGDDGKVGYVVAQELDGGLVRLYDDWESVTLPGHEAVRRLRALPRSTGDPDTDFERFWEAFHDCEG